MYRQFLRRGLLAPLFVVLITPLFADHFKTIDIHHCEGIAVTSLSPNGSSNDNTIVGAFYSQTANQYHGFVYPQNGQCRVVDVPGATYTQINGINRFGRLVGCYDGADGLIKGFLLKDGIFTTLSYPYAVPRPTFSNGINNRSQIVGRYYEYGGTAYGFLYENGKYTKLQYPSAYRTWTAGINNAGVIVGFYMPNRDARTKGFICRGAHYESVTHPRGGRTLLYGINGDEEIVGYRETADGRFEGFLISNDSFNDLQFPGAMGRVTAPYGINRSGYVVGQYGPSPVELTSGFFWT